MTRINCIDPAMLTQPYLGAGWKETPRIITEVETLIAKGVTYDDYAHKIPSQYVFGAGHNTFFYNKLGWIASCLTNIYYEGHARGYEYSREKMLGYLHRIRLIRGIDDRWCGGWRPTHDDIMLNMARLVQNHYKTAMRVDGRSVIDG